MKKAFNILLIISIFLITLTGCSNKSVKKEEEYKKDLTYSNLTDSSSQAEVKKAMKSAGILSENIDSFFQNVNYYNNAIEKKSLVKDGFVTIDSLEPEYDQSAMEEMWNTKNPEFIGYNCRITSFDLMKKMISVGNPDTKNSRELFMDEDALEHSPKKLFNKVEQEEFKSVFSFVPTENTKDISVHLNKVKEDWKSKDIKFLNKDKVSLISVFFHSDEDNYLFIGHAGVLIPSEDGKLLFVEKLSFQEPYQVIKFNNRIELNDYLMNKYDISWDQPTAKPFIMENDQLLEGYRENPNNL
ncbi:DUF4300 family protein [Anaerosalibacter bizertensis]|uniref:DUF4300 family protein n=1 Tax=Anaerosalibacter bizertensis TaxID=932217 RepID=UPI001C0F137B|nr:DUF4300 family protein [Anaerosalibacter bizertensis]MBU5292446.1 DUF4300 family protein [Anaerosalibacter bizertensis]